ncbi:MAG: efflux transporter outer membrane subunit [Chlamydiota bacterium]
MRKSLLAICLLFSGCLSMGQKEKTEHLQGPQDLGKSIQTGLESGLFAQGNWPKEAWWEGFNSETLNRWIEEGFLHNPSLQSVQSRIDAAKQKAKVTESKLFPFLFFNADDNIAYFSKNGLDHAFNPSLPLHGYDLDLSLAFTYEFDFWGKNRNMFKAAIGDLRAQEAEFAQARLILSTSLAQSYFALLINYRKKDAYQRLLDIRKDKLDLQNRLVESALSSRLIPLLDDESVQDAEQTLLFIKDEIEVQTHLINILLGKNPDTDLPLDTLKGSSLPSIFLPETLSADLLSRRPDLMAQIWRVESLAHQVSAAKADFFPNINLTALAGFESLSFSNLFSMASKMGSITPALSLPIFNSGAIKANMREKKAIFDEAIFQYNQLILTSAQEVADLISNIQMTFSQKRSQERALEDSKERLFLTTLRLKGGLDTTFSVLDSEEEVISQDLKDLDILYSEYAFVIKLTKALGGGYQAYSPLEVKELP